MTLEIINVTCTVLATIGGFVAWWQATKSKAAQKAAEEQAGLARQSVAKLEEIRDAILTTSAPPVLELTYEKGRLYRLRNNSEDTVTVEEVVNADQLFRVDLKPGTEIKGGGSEAFIIAHSNGRGSAAELVLKMAGKEKAVVLPIPKRVSSGS